MLKSGSLAIKLVAATSKKRQPRPDKTIETLMCVVFHVELAVLAMGNEGDGQTGMTNEVVDAKMTKAKWIIGDISSAHIAGSVKNWHRTQDEARERRNPSVHQSENQSKNNHFDRSASQAFRSPWPENVG